MPVVLLRQTIILASLLLLAACDENQIARAKGYVERLTSGFLDQAGAEVSADRAPIAVSAFLPEPNYAPSRSPTDAAELTDGKLERPPLWVRDGGVGWFGQTPVVIDLQRRDGADSVSGRVRVHAGLGRYAGTELPRQIDVYSHNTKGQARLVGSYREPAGLMPPDKKSYWIEIPVRDLGHRFSLALHAGSAYVQIDEIEFVPGEVARALAAAEPFDAPDLQAIRDDAAAQLRLNFEIRAADRSDSRERWREAIGTGQVAWVAGAWDDKPGQWGPEVLVGAPAQLQFAGLDSETEIAAIGVYSTGMGLSEVSVSIDGVPAGALQLFQVGRVMTADGELVYDPLKPLQDGKLQVQAGWPELLWVQADLSKLPAGRTQATLTLKGTALEQRFPLQFTVLPDSDFAPAALDAKVWAYSRDLPLWSDPAQTMADLLAHHVNVWVIHPSDIPGLNLDGKSDNKAQQRFLADLVRYKGHGKVHLYLGWTGKDNPFGITPSQTQIPPARANAFRTWLSRIDDLLRDAGYAPQDWALYPMDEISGEETRVFREVALLIRETLPSAQIYANPISTSSDPTTVAQLQALEELVDQWQPVSKLYHSAVGSYFDDSNVAQGFFHIPDVPAKAASPMQDYRVLGWHAWQRGANAIGFWAYSDATGSSVWDDFDGRRPDFAVVYEQGSGLVSSRRWEAFAQGIEDHRLLAGSGLAVPADFDAASLTPEMLSRWRARALKRGAETAAPE
ncbi:hypothetical protein Q4485_11775 [Granulosicoccaceae sp. 1_MG-2023]|nr:hypothetical protein [Granulosicoccaceae sp. 1_MG-2023]